MIARTLKLPTGTSVILAASGTDSELLALALGQAVSGNRPITTILLAPEETGSGVPMAAIGRHFAIDTANGHDVTKASPIYGFREDTKLVSIPLRDRFGEVRPSADVESDIRAAVDLAIVEDRQILLHALDLSKTGLLAPSLSLLRDLRTLHEDRVEIVVDACQMRVQPDVLHDYLAIGAIVQITGSKFLTGPPFAGAVLIPRQMSTLLKSGTIPEGLDAYFSTGDFPRTASIARNLPPGANFGLILRWRAALAELNAFLAVPDERKTKVLVRFHEAVDQAIGSILVPGTTRLGPRTNNLRIRGSIEGRCQGIPRSGRYAEIIPLAERGLLRVFRSRSSAPGGIAYLSHRTTGRIAKSTWRTDRLAARFSRGAPFVGRACTSRFDV